MLASAVGLRYPRIAFHCLASEPGHL